MKKNRWMSFGVMIISIATTLQVVSNEHQKIKTHQTQTAEELVNFQELSCEEENFALRLNQENRFFFVESFTKEERGAAMGFSCNSNCTGNGQSCRSTEKSCCGTQGCCCGIQECSDPNDAVQKVMASSMEDEKEAVGFQ